MTCGAMMDDCGTNTYWNVVRQHIDLLLKRSIIYSMHIQGQCQHVTYASSCCFNVSLCLRSISCISVIVSCSALSVARARCTLSSLKTCQVTVCQVRLRGKWQYFSAPWFFSKSSLHLTCTPGSRGAFVAIANARSNL